MLSRGSGWCRSPRLLSQQKPDSCMLGLFKVGSVHCLPVLSWLPLCPRCDPKPCCIRDPGAPQLLAFLPGLDSLKLALVCSPLPRLPCHPLSWAFAHPWPSAGSCQHGGSWTVRTVALSRQFCVLHAWHTVRERRPTIRWAGRSWTYRSSVGTGGQAT